MTDYQFYLLFRKSHWKKDEYVEEPCSLPPSVYEDQDKRLFSFHVPHVLSPLSSEQLCHYLFDFWQETRSFYQNCLVQDTHHSAMTREESEDLFVGGIILMIDDQFEASSHTLRLTLYNDETLEIGEVLFLPPSNVETSSLLSLCDKDSPNTSPARFVNFEVIWHLNHFKDKSPFFQWLLKFNHHRAYLMPIQKGGHPILKVYGLLRGEISTWEDRLADFLVYRQHPVLPTLMSLSLMHQWQERNFYVRATQWIKTLEEQHIFFSQRDESTSFETLQQNLHKLESLVIETKDLLAITEQLFDISNFDELMHHMYRIQGEAKREQWVSNWHWQQEMRVQLLQACFPSFPSQPTYPALVNNSLKHRYDMKNLKNSLEEQLRHLEGHRSFLIISLKKQEHLIKEKFIAVGSSIVLSSIFMMVIIAGLKGLFQEYSACCCVNCGYLHLLSTVLENPLIYFVFILLTLTPIFQQEWKFYQRKRKSSKSYS